MLLRETKNDVGSERDSGSSLSEYFFNFLARSDGVFNSVIQNELPSKGVAL